VCTRSVCTEFAKEFTIRVIRAEGARCTDCQHDLYLEKDSRNRRPIRKRALRKFTRNSCMNRPQHRCCAPWRSPFGFCRGEAAASARDGCIAISFACPASAFENLQPVFLIYRRRLLVPADAIRYARARACAVSIVMTASYRRSGAGGRFRNARRRDMTLLAVREPKKPATFHLRRNRSRDSTASSRL
jgi:hypothetical protein